MLGAMAEGPPTATDPSWHESTVSWFHEHLLDPEHFAAFVADDPELGVVACAVGSMSSIGAPIPGVMTRARGQVLSVATDPGRRRRGHARACMAAVLAWLDEIGVAQTALSATPDGIELYRSLGFVERPWTHMWR